MSKDISVLSNAKFSDVRLKPFPYIVIRDALIPRYAEELTREFPIHCFNNLNENNKRDDISACDVCSQDNISNLWKQFISYHASQSFFDEVVALFGEAILGTHQKFYKNLDELKNMSVGTRHVDDFRNFDALMDAQISINSPVTHESSVRSVHVDRPNKIFSGLFYLRQPNDQTKGGDLQICKWKESVSAIQRNMLYQESLQEELFEVLEEIKFENNVAILFINSLNSLHGVTPRAVTGDIRTFANLVCEVPQSLYLRDNFANRLIKDSKAYIKKILTT